MVRARKKDSKAEKQVLPARNSLESVGRCPLRDYRCANVEDIGLGHGKRSAKEKHTHSYAEQYTAKEAVEEQEAVVDSCAVYVAFLRRNS